VGSGGSQTNQARALRTKVHKNEQEHPWEVTLCGTVPWPSRSLASDWPQKHFCGQSVPIIHRGTFESKLFALLLQLIEEKITSVHDWGLRKYRHRYWAPIGCKRSHRQDIDWVVEWNRLEKVLVRLWKQFWFPLWPGYLPLWFLRMFHTLTSIIYTMLLLILSL